MAHRKLPEGIRQEFLFYRGHQVVVTYNDNTNEVTIETNGSVKKRIVQTAEDAYTVYDGRGTKQGKILIDPEEFQLKHIPLLLSERDLED